MKRFAAFLAVSGTLLLARAAGAAEPASFWIEAHPWSCSQHVAPVARELALACDAAGRTCSVASSEASAARRIFLKCDDTKWTIETHDAKGVRLWSVDVAGDPSDRARSAAVFAVRAETGETLPSPPPAREPPIAVNVDAPPGPDKVKDAEPNKPSGVSMSLAPRAQIAVGNVTDDASFGRDGNSGGLMGFGFATTWNVEGIRIGPAAGGALGLRYSNNREQAAYWNAGVVAGVGAPFERKVFGLVVDAGYGQRFAADVRHFGYVRPSVIAQMFPTSEIRPFLAASYQLMVGGASGHYLGADLGLAWDL
jgi:hypothetical protein